MTRFVAAVSGLLIGLYDAAEPAARAVSMGGIVFPPDAAAQHIEGCAASVAT
jgi:hypothetical protein